MPPGHTQFRDVRVDCGTAVHRQGGDLPQADKNMDTQPGQWSRTYCGLDDSAQTAYAWDR